jgi:hypothetical protein
VVGAKPPLNRVNSRAASSDCLPARLPRTCLSDRKATHQTRPQTVGRSDPSDAFPAFVLCRRLRSKQRYRRVLLILPSPSPNRSSNAVVGIDGLFEESIRCEPLPKLETQIAVAERPRPFQSHLVQQNASDPRILGWTRHATQKASAAARCPVH